MNRIAEIGLLILFGVMTSCTDGRVRISALPEKLTEADRYGLVDSHGRIVSDNAYTSVGPVVNGFFNATGKRGVTVFRFSSNPTSVAGLTDLKDAGYMNEGLIPVATRDNRLGVVDVFGRMRFTLRYIAWRRIVGCAACFRNGLLWVMADNGLWGAVSRSGRPVIEPVYYCEPFFSADGYALATRQIGDDRFLYSFIDKSGCRLYEFSAGLFPTSYVVKNQRVAYVTDSGKHGLIDVNGERSVLPAQVREIRDFNDTYIIYGDSNGRYGLMGYDGKIKLRARFASLDFGFNGQFIASDGENLFLIDCAGRRLADFPNARDVLYIGEGEDAVVDSEFCYLVKTERMVSLVDAAGSRIGDNDFVSIDYYPLVNGGINTFLSTNPD